MNEEILNIVFDEDNLMTINGNIGVAEDFVIEALERDPIPVVHI